jgi:hypothetical protein
MRRALRGWEFSSTVLVVLALVPAGAHLFELPNKMALSPAEYMIAQQLYSGWALFGLIVIPALISTLVYAWLLRDQPRRFAAALLAFALMAISHAVFWIFTQPMNRLTQNWTQLPEDLARARAQWEYSHAVGAVLVFFALLALLRARAAEPAPASAQADQFARAGR